MLPSDPQPWSDASGEPSLPHKALFPAPPGHEFVPGSDWVLDLNFHRDLDCAADGWIYTDNRWADSRAAPGFLSVTRRRCWVRPVYILSEDQSNPPGAECEFAHGAVERKAADGVHDAEVQEEPEHHLPLTG